MNVSIIDREPISGQGARKVLSVNKDFAAGEVIYKACGLFRFKNDTNELLSIQEFPFVVALDHDLQEKGSHCSQCLRPIQPEMSLKLPRDSSSTWLTAPKPA
jgi:import receptor subunit TOM20